MRFGKGKRHADFSSQVSDDDADDQGCYSGEHRSDMNGCGAIGDIGVDRLEVVQAR